MIDSPPPKPSILGSFKCPCLSRRHTIKLARAFQGCNPTNPLRGKQLGTGLDAIDDIDIVENAGLDEAHAFSAAERVAVAPHGGTTVAAEGARDGLAAVGYLGDLLWFSRQDLEVGRRHHNVVAVVAA